MVSQHYYLEHIYRARRVYTDFFADKRFDAEAKSTRRHDRDRDRRDRDEYSDDGLEDWERDEKKPVRMLEGPSIGDNLDRRSDRREREGSYVSSRGGRD